MRLTVELVQTVAISGRKGAKLSEVDKNT